MQIKENDLEDLRLLYDLLNDRIQNQLKVENAKGNWSVLQDEYERLINPNDKTKAEIKEIIGSINNNLVKVEAEIKKAQNIDKKEVEDEIFKFRNELQLISDKNEKSVENENSNLNTNSNENLNSNQPINSANSTSNSKLNLNTNGSPRKSLPPINIATTPTNTVTSTPNSTQPTTESYFLIYTTFVVLAIIATAVITVLTKQILKKLKLNNIDGTLKQVIKAKEELVQQYLKKGRSNNIHAIGVGKIVGTENYCIQIFVEDASGNVPVNPPLELIPPRFQNYPVIVFEMPRAEFLSESNPNFDKQNQDYLTKARSPQEYIFGGVSGANANLSKEVGTIGYFCRPPKFMFWQKGIYLLSNSHVLADLKRVKKDETDFIHHPSLGENNRSQAIAELSNFVPIKFNNDIDEPNFVDAAIAKVFQNTQKIFKDIPFIGAIKGVIAKEKIELRTFCRKFGRTTGYTQGQIFSIHFSIWVRYSATGQESFFTEQFLIVPQNVQKKDFVNGGDSGSLVVDFQENALGLIFAGAKSDRNFDLGNQKINAEVTNLIESYGGQISNFGVANHISDVLKKLNVELV